MRKIHFQWVAIVVNDYHLNIIAHGNRVQAALQQLGDVLVGDDDGIIGFKTILLV